MAMASEVPYRDQGQADGTYHLKILVPSVAAGAIIGKKGGIIAHLQEETGAKVKMSKATDFYPGTTERVCLISGSVDAILKLHEFIMLKIIERPDPSAKMAVDFDHKRSVERGKQVKILVPNSTAAMIIGKCGSYIKQIKEESGAYIQISQNAKDNFTLAERCITVIGEIENNKIACHMILTKVVKDPNSGSCLYVSYAGITGPVPNFDPVGSPFANPDRVSGGAVNNITNYNSNVNIDNLNQTVANTLHNLQTGATQPGIVPFTGVRMSGSALPLTNVVQAIETVKTMLIGNGYSEQAISDIIEAMNTLANYGLLGLDLGILVGASTVNNLEMSMPSSATNCPISPEVIADQGIYASATNVIGVEAGCNPVPTSGPMVEAYSKVFNPNDGLESEMSASGFRSGFISPTPSLPNTFLEQTDTDSFKPFCRTSPTLASPSAAALPLNANSFGLVSSSDPPSLKKYSDPQRNEVMKINIEVAENVIGAIFGPEGKAVAEIARFSGANIKISKKGEYAPGTRNRIVTVFGDSGAVNIAQYLIEQQLVQEEIKRSQRYATKFLQ